MSSGPNALRDALADRYRIERELGAGGMATVFLAHDVRHDRKVALKVLRPELSAILGGERFLAEIKTTANLQHPHILGLFDSGEAAGLVYYVMPFVEGESLRDRLNRDHQLPVDEAIRLAREVADALQYAHEHGVVHRDIKPENILLHGGHAVVADFGIALAASRSDGGSRMTETGMSLGTPHYMSPEQAMGEREVTPKADIYALGCVLYEMLTAEPPFTGANAQAIIGRVLTEDPRSLTAQRRTIPSNVEAAVLTAMAKLPADRFASAKAFAEALVKDDFAMAGTRRATSAAGGATSPVERPSTRMRALRAAPWVVAVAAVATSAWQFANRPEPVVTWQRTTLWSRPIIPGAVGLNLGISPDGNTIVYADTVGGVRQLWSKERGQLEPTALAGTSMAFGSGNQFPTFSPDGEWIAYVEGTKLKRVPRAGGSAITVSDSANGTLPAIAWLDDGTILFNGTGFALLAIGIDDGESQRLLTGDGNRNRVVHVSPLPGGRGALVVTCPSGCNRSELSALDLRSGALSVLTSDVLRAWYDPRGDVVFVRKDGGVFRVPFDVDELSFRGSPVPVLDGVRTSTFSADMILSASGTLLFVKGESAIATPSVEGVLVTRDGRATPIDPRWTYAPSSSSGIALSPDGRLLAVSAFTSGNTDIWVKELPVGPFRRLTFEGENTRPAWTADSRTVLYASQKDSGNGDLAARRADGTGTESILLDAERDVGEILRTRDTARLLVRYGTPSRDIHLFDRRTDSATTSPLLANEGYGEAQPALSSDGRWLAYTSNETGRDEIFVRPFPDVNSGRWQVSRDGGVAARWARNGRELFYRDESGSLIRAVVRPGTTFDLGEQEALFSTTGYLRSFLHHLWDLTPDDQGFIFLRRVGPQDSESTAPVSVVQVDNWFSELNTAGRRRR